MSKNVDINNVYVKRGWLITLFSLISGSTFRLITNITSLNERVDNIEQDKGWYSTVAQETLRNQQRLDNVEQRQNKIEDTQEKQTEILFEIRSDVAVIRAELKKNE